MSTEAETEPEAGAVRFDPGRPYRLSPSVSLRPEPFGALVYDFGTRRLSFLKTLALVAVVRELENQADVHSALAAADVPVNERAKYLDALASLAVAGTIQPAEPPRTLDHDANEESP